MTLGKWGWICPTWYEGLLSLEHLLMWAFGCADGELVLSHLKCSMQLNRMVAFHGHVLLVRLLLEGSFYLVHTEGRAGSCKGFLQDFVMAVHWTFTAGAKQCLGQAKHLESSEDGVVNVECPLHFSGSGYVADTFSVSRNTEIFIVMEWKSILINIWFSWSYRLQLFYILFLTGIVLVLCCALACLLEAHLLSYLLVL